MSSTPSPLAGVKALLFDVFGTVVDWEGSVHKLLEAKVAKEGISESSRLASQLDVSHSVGRGRSESDIGKSTTRGERGRATRS